MKLPGFIQRLWTTFKSPSKAALWVLLLMGFFGGVIFWGGFNTAMEASNTEAFCTSCHEMKDNVFEEYRDTIHYANRSGVRASCPDCHVPHEWTYKIIRKVQASKELWGMITGKVDTREKFESHRREMAEREWQRMKRPIRASAVTATTSNTWTSPCRGSVPPRCTRPTSARRGRAPASTVTRGLLTSCPT